MRDFFRQQLIANEYPGYVYGYPHKKAYRPLAPRPLADVWQNEDVRNLFCYVHIPFCNQRCSFCNLFTYVPGGTSPVASYLDALAREMQAYRHALPGFAFRRLYLGGGTPSFLTIDELWRLVHLLGEHLDIHPLHAHACIETSPESLDEAKVVALREMGFQRLSLGIQSFEETELRHVNRSFDYQHNLDAIAWVGNADFPQFNIDLIYGLPGQSLGSWRTSLERALDSPATSLFLYPLYIRPLTGLDRRSNRVPSPAPLAMGQMYDLALERLCDAGFVQLSMRQFRRDAAASWSHDERDYLCQRDGMVGFGAGARSYTQCLHYSTPWRMRSANIREVIEQYCQRMNDGDTHVSHGYVLDDDEQRRRYVIQCLLSDGVRSSDFAQTFDENLNAYFEAQWEILEAEACVRKTNDGYELTARGVRHADVVGQLFFSDRVRQQMADYEYDV